MKYIIFYDGTCGFCTRSITFVVKRDHKKIFYYAPLQGITAKKELEGELDLNNLPDTLVLVEKDETSKKVLIRSKAVFRILWLLGGFWKILGAFSFLPSFLIAPFDLGYRLVAKYRHDICDLPPSLPQDMERFLP